MQAARSVLSKNVVWDVVQVRGLIYLGIQDWRWVRVRGVGYEIVGAQIPDLDPAEDKYVAAILTQCHYQRFTVIGVPQIEICETRDAVGITEIDEVFPLAKSKIVSWPEPRMVAKLSFPSPPMSRSSP